MLYRVSFQQKVCVAEGEVHVGFFSSLYGITMRKNALFYHHAVHEQPCVVSF